MPSKKITVILNACAGGGHAPDFAGELGNTFLSLGMQAHVVLAKDGGEILAAARAAAKGQGIVVAGGGDGTINAVASVLAGTDAVMGVLPLGTLNHFSKDLRIPQTLEDAVRNIAEGYVVKVDAGEVNGKLFLNNSSLGLYPEIVRHREKQQHMAGRGKWHAFFWAFVTALRRFPFLNATIRLHDGEHKRRTPFVFIGNNSYVMEGFRIGARERLDAGQLSLYVTQRTGRAGLFMLALRALFGGLRQAKEFDAVAAREVLIETRRKHVRVATDGEVTLMETPLHYRIRPGALNVIVPKDAWQEKQAGPHTEGERDEDAGPSVRPAF